MDEPTVDFVASVVRSLFHETNVNRTATTAVTAKQPSMTPPNMVSCRFGLFLLLIPKEQDRNPKVPGLGIIKVTVPGRRSRSNVLSRHVDDPPIGDRMVTVPDSTAAHDGGDDGLHRPLDCVGSTRLTDRYVANRVGLDAKMFAGLPAIGFSYVRGVQRRVHHDECEPAKVGRYAVRLYSGMQSYSRNMRGPVLL